MSSPLVGPPELREPVTGKRKTSSGPSDPFMDAMVSNFNKSSKVKDHSSPRRGLTENGADTYLSAGNPCLDFFFHVVPSSSKKDIEERLIAAWDHDALTTLKLIYVTFVKSEVPENPTSKGFTRRLYGSMVVIPKPSLVISNPSRNLVTLRISLSFFTAFYKAMRSRKSQRISRGTSGRAPISNPGRGSGDVRQKSRKKKRTRELRIANAEKRNQVEKEKASLDR
ncbi:unnamed protein product [Arabis nemorensis]|uniref:DUF2828 domain-containing protein n=1 Tax=Arabis nemorensis TaxID=586526 RepID=A0A565CKY7_9BRAS|nr:unnamed protein product [Arabis nemorensis]